MFKSNSFSKFIVGVAPLLGIFILLFLGRASAYPTSSAGAQYKLEAGVDAPVLTTSGSTTTMKFRTYVNKNASTIPYSGLTGVFLKRYVWVENTSGVVQTNATYFSNRTSGAGVTRDDRVSFKWLEIGTHGGADELCIMPLGGGSGACPDQSVAVDTFDIDATTLPAGYKVCALSLMSPHFGTLDYVTYPPRAQATNLLDWDTGYEDLWGEGPPPYTFNPRPTPSSASRASRQSAYGITPITCTTVTTPPPVIIDVCPNIAGNQGTMPPGYIKDGSGNCVVPDQPPQINIPPPNCSAFTATINISDPDRPSSSVNPTIIYSINGTAQTPVSAWSHTFALPSPQDEVIIIASSTGVNPNPPGGLGTNNRTVTVKLQPCATPFTLKVIPQKPVLNDNENPTSVKFTSIIQFNLNPPNLVNGVTAVRAYYIKRGASVISLGGSSNTITINEPDDSNALDSPDIPISQPIFTGDQICMRLTISPASGFVANTGTIVGTGTGSSSEESCDVVASMPFFRTFGADIYSGAGFGVGCTTNISASIQGFGRSEGGRWKGAGSQLASFANGTIKDFKSLIIATAPAPSGAQRDRLFANDTGAPNGGGFGQNFCAEDYWATMDNPASHAETSYDILNFVNGQHQIPDGSTLYETAPARVTNKIAIYVDGDLRISNNLYSAETWPSVAKMSSVFIIVKGNIYIDPSVTRLDGNYVAMPRTTPLGGAAGASDLAQGGRIYTCATGFTAPTPAQLTTDPVAGVCSKNKLTVKGTMTATHINLFRTHGTLRESNPLESYDTPTADSIAELIKWAPEVFITTPSIAPKTTATYDSIVSLPPPL